MPVGRSGVWDAAGCPCSFSIVALIGPTSRLRLTVVATRRAGPRARGAEALEPVLAPNAVLHLGHGAQSRRRDRLAALHAATVLPLVQPVERHRQAVHSFQEQLARGEADLPALAGLDPVELVNEGAVLSDRPGQSVNRHRPAQLAKSGCSRFQVLIEPLPDVIDGGPPSTP